MTAVEKVDWFCPKCNSYVSSESVTFEETHQICNTGVILEPLNQNKMTAVEFLESQYKFNGQLFKSDFQQAKEMEDSQATEYAKWSMDINELTGHFFTFCEWIKDEPKDDETSKQE